VGAYFTGLISAARIALTASFVRPSSSSSAAIIIESEDELRRHLKKNCRVEFVAFANPDERGQDAPNLGRLLTLGHGVQHVVRDSPDCRGTPAIVG